MINYEELSERKLKILHAVIQNYLETGEPVGSRTISKYTDLNLSSATIRNEMADLEEMGYIIQPHTSAGRIPSDKGYRLYVDMLMEEKEQELNEMQEQMLDKADKMDQLLKQAARVLATNTNYATMVSTPMNNSNKIKFIQLSMVDEEQVIAVIVLGGNVIKNKIINIDEPISNENLLKLNMLLNTTLNGMAIEEINLGLIARLKEQAGIHSQVVGYVLDAVADAIHLDDDMQIYTSGATNIFKYPELSDNQSAQEIISAFEEKQQLSELVTQTLAKEDNTGIQVYIGDETPVQTMRDCSVVTATYELGDGMKGTIGIIGPKRMDYAHVLKSMKRLQTELDQMFHNLPINVFEERNPSLLHGKVGAFMAKNKYGITDEEILSAITWHTTGKDNMTDLEKIVFCADYIEPGRTKQPHLEELRSIALSDLDMLTFRILEDTVEYLKAKSLDCIDDNTITAYNFYKKLIEER